LRFDRHHTPPEKFLRAVGFFCGASLRRLLSEGQRRARRDVRCARPLRCLTPRREVGAWERVNSR
jgi:hypothetical protein